MWRAPALAQVWHSSTGFLSLAEVSNCGIIVDGDALGDESDLIASCHSPEKEPCGPK